MKLQNNEAKFNFFNSLNERDKRLYSAIESRNLGWGGITMVSELFGIHRNTITKGLKELNINENLNVGYVRKPGGGRKKNDN